MSALRLRVAAATASAALLAGVAVGPAFAASVTPIFIDESKNIPCDTLGEDYADGATWTLGVEAGTTNGTYTSGSRSVTISNMTNHGTYFSFEFSSNFGVRGAFVKTGADGHNLYIYNPTVESDTDLRTPGNNGISHIYFCVGGADATPTPTPTPTETATPSPTPSGSGGEEGDEGTPPPTSTVSDQNGDNGAWRIALLGIGGVIGTMLVVSPSKLLKRR